MASPDLLWLLVRNNSSFLVKRNGAEFTSEPGNLTNMNSFKFSGLANRKAVDVSVVKNKVTIGLKKSKQSKVRSPAKAWATSVLSRTTPRAGQIPASIRKITAGSHYRPDLARFAIARYHALRRTLAVKKADKKQQRRVRGRKAKAAAAAAAQAKLAKATKKDAKPAAAKKTDDKKKN